MLSRSASSLRHAGQVVLFIVVCEAAGALGALLTTTGEGSWYAALAKPAFTPPDWLFGPVWVTLYAMMGVAAYLIWTDCAARSRRRTALGWFAAQLALNAAWTPVFFGAESIIGGAVIIVALWAVLLVTVVQFFRIRCLAGWLLVPYQLWVTYAAALNIGIWVLN